ncbi:peptidoglycan-binding LysM [Arthrobacter crystallopoietes BAB-32]|uniref:Peptidoglycan-binding LysM n=1 Tax=Arthrobacter crystallopoietes BAB-32 TaxID=1246476 RepID=N1V0N2_9MICC|nr:lytic transglycosylase domain-containing protein [Arthrobacter crystallopoietes]EMY33604.1 peptidoglycan-binding LysM [Arthrobacter crystallopoietes BAB-32]
MTDQRPFSSSRAQGRTATQSSRALLSAAATAAIPAVVLSSAALAAPAQAAELPPRTILQPKLAGPDLPLNRGTVIPASEMVAQLPATLRPALQATLSAHTVKAGDTISGIAAKYGLSTSKVLSLNGLRANSIIYPGQKIKLGGSPAASGAASVSRTATSAKSYTVKAGDTLSGIAARHGMGLSKILSLNGLKATSIIYPGQKIKVSGTAAASPSPARTSTASTVSSAKTYTVKAGDTLSGIAARHGMGLSKILSLNGLQATSIIYPGQKIRVSGTAAAAATAAGPAASVSAVVPVAKTYTVKAGDTLYGIALKHNTTLSKLLQSSGLKSTSVIHPGQKIKLPGSGGGSTAVSAATAGQLVPNTFLHYTYPDAVVAKANENKRLLLSTPQPSQAQMKAIIADTARSMGVDPALALAHAYQESGFQQTAVSPANAIGAMQVIPSSGDWASDLVGRKLNLLDPYDNATAGIAIIRSLVRTSDSLDKAIASYYQGQYSVSKNGMYDDTKAYVKAIKAHMKNFQ